MCPDKMFKLKYLFAQMEQKQSYERKENCVQATSLHKRVNQAKFWKETCS